MESFRASSKRCGGSIPVVVQGQAPERRVWLGGAFNSCSPARVSTRGKSVIVQKEVFFTTDLTRLIDGSSIVDEITGLLGWAEKVCSECSHGRWKGKW